MATVLDPTRSPDEHAATAWLRAATLWRQGTRPTNLGALSALDADGVIWLELAPQSDADAVVDAVAALMCSSPPRPAVRRLLADGGDPRECVEYDDGAT